MNARHIVRVTCIKPPVKLVDYVSIAKQMRRQDFQITATAGGCHRHKFHDQESGWNAFRSWRREC